MTDITPADLAKFVHRVPVGAHIKEGTELVRRMEDGSLKLVRHSADYVVDVSTPPRWTAEPIRTAEHQRLEDEYATACEAVHAVEAEILALKGKREVLDRAAQRLYDQLRAAGHR